MKIMFKISRWWTMVEGIVDGVTVLVGLIIRLIRMIFIIFLGGGMQKINRVVKKKRESKVESK